MGNEYYGRNDYRDYLAHYGVKGMKWKKGRKTLTPEEIRAIRRNRLRERMASNENANARMEARANRLNRVARNGSSGGSGVKSSGSGTLADLYARNRKLEVTSGLRVEANRGQYSPTPRKKRTKLGKNIIKKIRAKNISAKAFSAKINTSKVNSIMNAMGGPALRTPASRRL